MDDASKQNQGLHLNVYAFNDKSVYLLVGTLLNKFSLRCCIHFHNSGKRIYIYKESIPKLRSLVIKTIVPSIFYKLGVL